MEKLNLNELHNTIKKLEIGKSAFFSSICGDYKITKNGKDNYEMEQVEESKDQQLREFANKGYYQLSLLCWGSATFNEIWNEIKLIRIWENLKNSLNEVNNMKFNRAF